MSSAKSTDSDNAVTPTQASEFSVPSFDKFGTTLCKTTYNESALSTGSKEGLIIGNWYRERAGEKEKKKEKDEKDEKGDAVTSKDESSDGPKGGSGDGDATPTQG